MLQPGVEVLFVPEDWWLVTVECLLPLVRKGCMHKSWSVKRRQFKPEGSHLSPIPESRRLNVNLLGGIMALGSSTSGGMIR